MNQKGFTPVAAVVIVVLIALTGYFIYSANFPTSDQDSAPETSDRKQFFLTLVSPTAETSAINDRVLVKGKTLPNTTVVLFNETDEATLESDAAGVFEGKLMLNEGENMLTITAFSESGEEKTINLSIDYNQQS